MNQPATTSMRASLLFLCLARDCEATLPSFLEYICLLRANGYACQVLIGENGSKDNTRALIQAGGDGIHLVDTSSMAAGGTRLQRMALGRELLLQTAREGGYLSCEFVCVADLDNVMANPPTLGGLQQAFARLRSDESIFAVSATSKPFYYDLLALRAPGHDYTTLHTDIEAAKRKPLSYYSFQRKRIYDKQLSIPNDRELVCESAFNGFCVYRAQDYGKGSYLVTSAVPVAEHVPFHQSIARQTSRHMIISPQLLLNMPIDHKPVSFLRFWMDRLQKKAGRMSAR